MAFIPGSKSGTLNGATPVTVVDAPGSGVVRQAHWIKIPNKDSAAVTLSLNLVDGINTRLLEKVTLAPGDNYTFDQVVVLDTTSKSITAVLGGAVATTQPDFVASYGDSS